MTRVTFSADGTRIGPHRVTDRQALGLSGLHAPHYSCLRKISCLGQFDPTCELAMRLTRNEQEDTERERQDMAAQWCQCASSQLRPTPTSASKGTFS